MTPSTDEPGGSILVVDDNQANLKLLRSLPRERGYAVRAARRTALAILIGHFGAVGLTGQEEKRDLFSMSLEELTNVRIRLPAASTGLTLAETPASITVITAEEIRFSPARNLYDHLETFVPGAIWMNREGGPLPGIRGSTVERNYKYLLRVNGRVMNSKAHFGASSELEAWDLSDIERIEVVRGPGSVTYGPGAVAGVINIVTHDAASDVPNRVAVRGVEDYNSLGLSANHTLTTDRVDLFAYANVTRTKGSESPQFLVRDNDEIGYVGRDILTDTEAMEYFADFQDVPQVKVHLDGRLGDPWRLWLRYTQQGSTWRSNEAKSDFDGVLLNQQGLRNRQWMANLEHSIQWADYGLSSMLSLGSFDGERRTGSVRDPDPDSPLNKRVDFAERELFLRSALNWRPSDGLEVAVGGEYAWDRYGAGWGDEPEDMRHGNGGNIVSSPSSRAISPTSRGSADRRGNVVFVGDGWSTHSWAGLSEANLVISPRVRVLLSARADKTTDSDWLFSSRGALIAEVREGRFVKLTAQRSRRLNTAAQVLIASRNGLDPDEESVTGLELAYTAYAETGFNVDVAAFWNDTEVIAGNDSANTAIRVGDLELYGIEGMVDYRWETGRIGANYSWVRQLDWRLAPGIQGSGISYADYNQPLQGANAVQVGHGNDLNNWPNQAFKAFTRLRLGDRITLHVDSRIFWDYQGAKDGLIALQNAVQGLPEEAEVAAALQTIEPFDVYGSDFRLNASLTYGARTGVSVQVFAQNLIGLHGNKRYAYDPGNRRASPRRIRYVEEPRVFGVTITYLY